MKNNIGVVVATYNGEKYIVEQLESIVKQSVKPDLIIVTDGGSTDKTVNTCADFLSKSNVNYKILTSKKNLGVKENFEKGLMNCDSKYIFFSDQDDYWLVDKIKNTMVAFENKDVVAVFCNAYITNDELKKTGNTIWKQVGYKPLDYINIYEKQSKTFQLELLRHNVITGMCLAIDSRIKNYILPFSDYSIHDVWIAHSSNLIGSVVSVNSKDVLYRQHGNNAIGANKNIVNSFNKRKMYLKKIENRQQFINNLLLRYKMNNDIYKLYNDYSQFINKRINYIKKNRSFFSIITLLKEYNKYEHNYWNKISKDVLSRLILKRDDMDEEKNN